MNSSPVSDPQELGTTTKGIPIRNLWLLMLYASDCFRVLKETDRRKAEDNPDELPDLIAEILAMHVERRLKRNLSVGFQRQNRVLSRVRGRINIFETNRQRLLEQGRVACRFEEITRDTLSNRYVCAALTLLAGMTRSRSLRGRCRGLATTMRRMGVSGVCPGRYEMAKHRDGSRDQHDRLMLATSRLAFAMNMPTEQSGTQLQVLPARDEHWLRRLFERAVGGFYDVVLGPVGWRVRAGMRLDWQVEKPSPQFGDWLPKMITDIVLESVTKGCRIVIDTKFNQIFTSSHFRDQVFRSGELYQMYAYVRSQEGVADDWVRYSEGLLLHPSVGVDVDESADIQGHRILFATVDLSKPATEIRRRLLELVGEKLEQDSGV